MSVRIEAGPDNRAVGGSIQDMPMMTWFSFASTPGGVPTVFFMRLMDQICTQGGTVLCVTTAGKVGTKLISDFRGESAYRELPEGFPVKITNE